MIPPVPVRSKTIKGGQWVVRLTLEVEDTTVREYELVYNDAWTARNPNEFGRLISQSVHDAALPLAKARSTKDKTKVAA